MARYTSYTSTHAHGCWQTPEYAFQSGDADFLRRLQAQAGCGSRARFSGDERIVIDGPFTETKELIAAFSIIKVKSKEKAIEWMKRAPNVFPHLENEVEIHKVIDVEDFGEVFTPNPEIAKVK